MFVIIAIQKKNGHVIMVNSVKKFVNSAKILAVALSLLILCFHASAIADTMPDTIQMKDSSNYAQRGVTINKKLGIPESVMIQDGFFAVGVQGNVPKDVTVEEAIVSFPEKPEEKGTINRIIIVGPDKSIEFDCRPDISVSQDVDLITICGKGPVKLKAGNTDYLAIGTGLKPDLYTRLRVNLQ